jgi:hypothetical protein
MDPKTARKYRDDPTLPSQRKTPRTYRTRTNPFANVWPEVEAKLQEEPRLQAKTLFDWLRLQHPNQFQDSHRRSFERRVREWRALYGPNKPVFFRQIHQPGDLAASDFTSMTELKITIGGEPFEHLVYHFVLTYSNWESITICSSESFEALSEGLQNAFWELGGVPKKHRTDSLTSAVNNHSEKREFQTRYRDLLCHYGVSGQRTNVRSPQENGDAESSHGHFKRAVDQALLLRGSRDFASREEYQVFLQEVVASRNAGRVERFDEELTELCQLPASRLSSCLKLPCVVSSGSTIAVHRNVYSVPSRLIGETVEAWLYADRVEVWYADTLVQTMPRLVGRGGHAINYRHIIDWLIRKPGAFANYAYREDLFPTTRFRMAYDRFLENREERLGIKDYLQVLHHAAHHGEMAVDDALRVLLSCDSPLSAEAVIALATTPSPVRSATEVVVEAPDLSVFDELLYPFQEEGNHGEEASGGGDSVGGGAVVGPLAGVAIADDSGSLRVGGDAVGEGASELCGVPGSADEPGNSGSDARSDSSFDAFVAVAAGEDVGFVPVDAVVEVGTGAVSEFAGRRVFGPSGERVVVWEAGFGEDARDVCVRGAVGVAGPVGVFCDVQLVGSGVARGEAGFEVGEVIEAVVELRGVVDRRLGLCAAESGGDGGVVHVVGGPLRAWECDVDEQFAVFGLGRDLQGPDDDGGGDRSFGSPQRDRGNERVELSTGDGKGSEGVGVPATGWRGEERGKGVGNSNCR